MGKMMEDMMFLMVDDELSFVNEIKGMNPILIYRPSDVRKAAEDVVDSAFRYMGQGVFSASKVIVTIDDQKRFTEALLARMGELNVTDPAEKDAFCGPLMNKDAAERYKKFLEAEAPHVIYGGERVTGEFTDNGYYFKPAILVGLEDEDENAFMDVGLPVLFIKTVADLDEAMEELAYTECGLAAGLYSKDVRIEDRIRDETDVEVVFRNCSSRTLRPGLRAKLETFSK